MRRVFVLTGGVVVEGAELSEGESALASPFRFTVHDAGIWLKNALVNGVSAPLFFVPTAAIVAEGQGENPTPRTTAMVPPRSHS